jgi:pimeloyl-ACP methyl ester carboxylesterase
MIARSLGVACLAAAAASCVAAATDGDRTIAVDGIHLHLRCAGRRSPGAPLVVLEAGAQSALGSWKLVQPAIAPFARVCAYDRAGRGSSEPAPPGQTAIAIVERLHDLLRAAGERPPFVMIGHSYGGMLVQLYANRHQTDVAGLVLVDSSHERQDRRFAQLPQDLRPPPVTAAESADVRSVMTELAKTPWRGAIPLVVLSRGKRPPIETATPAQQAQFDAWQELQSDLATRSPGAEHIIAANSGHNIQIDEPDLIVSAARRLTHTTHAIDSMHPSYKVDPFWPKPLPNHWILGAVAGIAVDAKDHVWVTHRPSTLQPNETRSIWQAAPPVLEFDGDGTLLSSWGGPRPGYEWPQLEHGIYVDTRDRVWLGGGGDKDAQILQFTRQGTFVMQIGHQGKGHGSNDTGNLGGAANLVVDEEAREVYVADGYVNHRVIVFDADTGAYKRHWGAYGKRPDDGWFTRAGEKLPGPFNGAVQNENRPSQYDPNGPPPEQFRIVHSVRLSHDGLVYVCDRTNDRLQVFRKDGTFVKEAFIAKGTFGSGSVWDLVFSTDAGQTYAIVIDGTNQQVYVVDRQTLAVVDTFGHAGHQAGDFYGAHVMAGDSHGNLFVGETYEGKRIQKFVSSGR